MERKKAIIGEYLLTHPKKIKEYVARHDWDAVLALTELLNKGIPSSLAQTDPARFRNYMKGITKCYLMGWNKLNPRVIKELIKKGKKYIKNR